MNDPTCAVWYWSHYALYVDLFDDEREAAGYAVSMEDHGTASIAGVQYQDGTYVDRGSWDAYQEEERRRGEEVEREMAAERERPKPATREVTPPFDARGTTATVRADYPEWLGAAPEAGS